MWIVLQTNQVPFDIRGVQNSDDRSLDKYEGLPARTLPADKWRSGPAAFEALVNVFVPGKRPRIVQVSIDPRFLVPWKPAAGSTVVVVDQYAIFFSLTGTVLRKDGDMFIVQFSDGGVPLERPFIVEQLAILERLE